MPSLNSCTTMVGNHKSSCRTKNEMLCELGVSTVNWNFTLVSTKIPFIQIRRSRMEFLVLSSQHSENPD